MCLTGRDFGGAMEFRGHGLPLMRAATDHLFREGQLLAWGIPATGVLVETLLDRGADGDVDEADTAIARLAAAPADDGLVIRDIWLLRLRALLARARGDETGYRDYRDRYRAMGTELGFEGHIEWADAMPPQKRLEKANKQESRTRVVRHAGTAPFMPCRQSDCPNAAGLQALGALGDLELHLLVLLEATEAVAVDLGVVHEDVRAVRARDEAEALVGVEPLHSSLCHLFLLVRIPGRTMRSGGRLIRRLLLGLPCKEKRDARTKVLGERACNTNT
jgi:hypothetical protein